MTARQPDWALMTDDVLRALGAKDNLVAATRAISEEMRAWHIPDGDGLVISHISVLFQESEDGVVWVDKLAPLHEAIAFGEEPRASIADRLSAALALVGASYNPEKGVTADAAARAQRVISDILVAHPVLLHPRLCLPIKGSSHTTTSFHSVLAAISARGAALPSVRHGLDHEAVERFATSKLVMAPFLRNAPTKAWQASVNIGRRKEQVDTSGPVLEAIRSILGTMKPPLLTSLFELSRLRGYDRAIISREAGDKCLMSATRHVFVRSLGMHAHKTQGGFRRPPREQALLDEIRQSRIMQGLDWRRRLDEEFNEAIFVQAWRPEARGNVYAATPQMVAENTELALDALVECQMVETRVDGASWLAESLLKDGKLATSQNLPGADIEGACAFYRTLEAAGLPFESLMPTKLEGRQPVWRTAYELVSRQRVMEAVLASAPAVTSPTGSAPQRRLRAV